MGNNSESLVTKMSGRNQNRKLTLSGSNLHSISWTAYVLPYIIGSGAVVGLNYISKTKV